MGTMLKAEYRDVLVIYCINSVHCDPAVPVIGILFAILLSALCRLLILQLMMLLTSIIIC